MSADKIPNRIGFGLGISPAGWAVLAYTVVMFGILILVKHFGG